MAQTRPSLALSAAVVGETLAISWPTVVDAFRHRVTKPVCDDRLDGWCHRVVRRCGAEVTIAGREHLGTRPTFIVMSNHQSLYDIPLLFYSLGPNLRMVTKKELFRIPIFGHAMKEAGFVRIDRGDRTEALASLDTARELARSGTNVWIAPEGTRSRTGELLPFKKGGFHLAFAANLPILPVSLAGTRDILQARAVRSVPGAQVRVTIHPPVDLRSDADAPRKDVIARTIDQVRTAIQSGLER